MLAPAAGPLIVPLTSKVDTLGTTTLPTSTSAPATVTFAMRVGARPVSHRVSTNRSYVPSASGSITIPSASGLALGRTADCRLPRTVAGGSAPGVLDTGEP